MNYVNYHRHSHYSNLVTPDTTLKPSDYIDRALELGHTTVVCMEHGHTGSMSEILEMYGLCKQHNLKLVVGAECYYVPNRLDKDKTNMHIVIIALNHNGIKQLNRIISEANNDGYYYKARIDRSLITSLNPKDFIITTACVAGVGQSLEDVMILKNHFADNFYLEIQSHNHPTQIAHNKKMFEYSKTLGIKLIHGNDTHYITEQHRLDRNIFLKGKGMDYGDESEFEIDYPDYHTILNRYSIQGVIPREIVIEAIQNTNRIENESESLKYDKEIKMPSLHRDKTHEEKMDILTKIVKEEFAKQYQGKILDKEELLRYCAEIKYELDIIRATRMEDYFILNYHGIKRGKELGGILTRTGRGSGVSFIVNKILGFTEIDRLQENIHLYPTRFMSVSRILETKSLPDIDFNTVDPKPFAQACKELLGEHNCYVMYSAGTMQIKEAFKNTCRAFNVNFDEANAASDNIDNLREVPKWKGIIEIAERMVGTIISVIPNPCGYLILDKDIREEIGVVKIKDEMACLIDKSTADEWKYLKNDFLTVKVWKIISEVYKEIGKPIDDIFNLNLKTKNNEKVWNLYRDGITATLNQTSTDFARPLAMRYSPVNVDELTAFCAGIRPSFASMMDYLLDRKSFSYGIPEFDKILESSMNFVLYQESIMATLVYVGFPEDETYGLIKAISKKKESVIKGIKQRFLDGFVAKTGSMDDALKVWQIIEDAAAYGFNSSHALAVAYDSVYGAYLKATYPLEYYKVVLNINADDEKMTRRLTDELKYFGINLENIKFRYSKANYDYDKNTNTIYKGIASIKYLSNTAAEELEDVSKHDFSNAVELFVYILENTTINTRQMEILIKLDFFREFGSSKYLFELYERFCKRYKKTLVEKSKVKRIEELMEFDAELDKVVDYSIADKVAYEYKLQGSSSLIMPEYPKDMYVITAISDNFTNRWITLYRINDGAIESYKMNIEVINNYGIRAGMMIRIDEVDIKRKSKRVGDKWVMTDELEPHLKRITVIKGV